jgi:hypothetical protein
MLTAPPNVVWPAFSPIPRAASSRFEQEAVRGNQRDHCVQNQDWADVAGLGLMMAWSIFVFQMLFSFVIDFDENYHLGDCHGCSNRQSTSHGENRRELPAT